MSIDDIYPPPASPASTWWVVRTKVVSPKYTLLSYSPLSVPVHPSKVEAQKYMADKVQLLNPAEVKVIGGPYSRAEAFNWTTLNPYVVQESASSSASTNAGNSNSSSSGANGSDPWANDPTAR